MLNLDALPSAPPRFTLGEVVLRPFRKSDAPALYAYLSDPNVTNLTSYDIRTLEDAERLLRWHLNAWASRTGLRWGIARQTDDVVVGTIGFAWSDPKSGRAEIGYDLAAAMWNKGIATAACRTVLTFACHDIGAHRIEATVMDGNDASIRVLEKLGFRREGLLRDYKRCRGEYRDFWMYSLLPHEFRDR